MKTKCLDIKYHFIYGIHLNIHRFAVYFIICFRRFVCVLMLVCLKLCHSHRHVYACQRQTDDFALTFLLYPMCWPSDTNGKNTKTFGANCNSCAKDKLVNKQQNGNNGKKRC